MNVYHWVDLLLYSYIPFLVMLICTIIIIYRLVRINNRLSRNSLVTTTTTTTTTATHTHSTAISNKQAYTLKKNLKAKKRQQMQQHQAGRSDSGNEEPRLARLNLVDLHPSSTASYPPVVSVVDSSDDRHTDYAAVTPTTPNMPSESEKKVKISSLGFWTFRLA